MYPGPHIPTKNLLFGADPASSRNGFMGNIVNADNFAQTNNNSTGTSDTAVKTLAPDGNGEYIYYDSNNNVRGLGDITIIGWAKQNSTSSPHQTIFSTSISYRWGLKLMSRYHGQWAAWIGSSGTSDDLVGSGSDITNDGKFHCLVCTRDSSSGNISLFEDGEILVDSTSTGITGDITESGVTAIAADYHSAGYYMDGLIGQVWVWDTILTDAEITQVYKATKERYK